MISSAQIRAARAMINAKQSELARAAGISLATLNNIERGVADPRASTLDAIERALYAAGIECESEGGNDLIRLSARVRPSGRESFSQRVLELLDRSSLLKPESILLFAHGDSGVAGGNADPVLGVMIEGAARTVLFDQASLSAEGQAGLAEIAGILLAGMALYGDRLFYCPCEVTSPRTIPTDQAIARLSSEAREPLSHPRPLLDLLGGWRGAVERAGTRFGHPMRDLIGFLGEEAEAPPPEQAEHQDRSARNPDETGAYEPSTDFVIVMDDVPSDEPEPQSEAEPTEADEPAGDLEFLVDDDDAPPAS